ncbi:DUF503 domain-containing protein [Gudongella sp. SC589]|jgi:hypothetical protein|uniref:DUF503 domain-containing protein n=1 Tax=Gudongella sp. SC589 TaxID=3385990 RepID=UPI003904D728
MIIGACSIELHIFEVHSLKEKRHVIKSILGRLQSRFNISVAEVDKFDVWQSSVIGIACVSNEATHVRSMISSVMNFVDADGRVEITNHEIEIL